MSSFEDKLLAFSIMVQGRQRDIHADVAYALLDSVVNGSPLTGSPGQPVDEGNLRTSWNLSFPAPLLAEILTNVVYAPAIEHGVGPHGPLTLRSEVGGFHSVALTRAGFQKIVRQSMDKVAKW